MSHTLQQSRKTNTINSSAADKLRLQSTMSISEMVLTMAENDLGAQTVLTELLFSTYDIDPQDTMRGLGPITTLDRLGIYGKSIWRLYRNICCKEIRRMILLLRANSLGIMGDAEIRRCSEYEPYFNSAGMSIYRYLEIEERVLERLDQFARK